MSKCVYTGMTGAAVLLCLFFLVSCNAFKEMKPVHEKKTFTARGIDSIKLYSTCAEVSFTSTSENTDDIQIVLSGSTSADTVLFAADVAGSQLEIEYDEMIKIIGGFRSRMKLTVEIPKSHLSKIEITSVSGNLDARNLDADVIHLKTTSGSLSATAMTGDLTAKSTSGKITLDKLDGALTANNTSGTIEAKKITGNVSVETVSGKIGIEGLTGELSADSTSGEIFAQFESAAKTNAESTSGSIGIVLPTASSFDYHMKSVFGSKRCDFRGGDSGTVGSGGPTITLSTTSGSIHIIER